MNETRFHTDRKVFSRGAWYAVDAQYFPIITNDVYLDGQNIRFNQVAHNQEVAAKIGGELLAWPLIDNGHGGTGDTLDATYRCVFAISVNDRLFEVWCDILGVLPVVFRVNGIIVAKSTSIPFLASRLMRGHKDDGYKEVFLTDRVEVPHIYSISDLLTQIGLNPDTLAPTGLGSNPTYFANYTDTLYQVNQATNADIPVFIQATANKPAGSIKIGTGGQRAGSVQYAIRMVDSQGNPSGWSQFTPLIPIPKKIGSESSRYPRSKTIGGLPAEETSIGIHVRFRITNLGGYASYQIRRITYNTGSALQTLGADEIIFSDIIGKDEISIKDIWDVGKSGEAYDPSLDDAGNLAVIKACGDVRYYNQKLYLFDVTYQSRSIEGVSVDVMTEGGNSDKIVPAMKYLGTAGHKSIYNQVYYKGYMPAEMNGWGLVGFDGSGQSSWAEPIEGTSTIYPICGDYKSFLFPSRREQAFTVSRIQEHDNSLTPLVNCFNRAGVVSDTFDPMHYSVMVSKDQSYCQYKNILNRSSSSDYLGTGTVNVYGCAINRDGGQDIGGYAVVDYQPWHPSGESDAQTNGLEFSPVGGAWGGGALQYDVNTYHPKGFAPGYSVMGVKVGGVSNLKSWVKAFSVVRTPVAERVFAQGLAMYSLYHDDILINKRLSSVWFYSPDSESGIRDMEDVINNPSNYELRLQSWMGFFTEPYNGLRDDSAGLGIGDRNVDMISYARIYFEDGSINSGDDVTTVGSNGHVTYNDWRNTTTTPGTQAFNITGARFVTTANQESIYFEIDLHTPIYATGSPVTVTSHFLDASAKEFHEPIFVANIIRKNATIDKSVNIQTYVPTGHYQKVESIVGISDGSTEQKFLQVDERWQDWYTTTSATDKFIYIRKADGTIEKWVNIAQKTVPDRLTILNDIVAGTGTYGDCKGVYTQETDTIGDYRSFTIVFSESLLNPAAFADQYFAPASGTQILVRYDARFPMEVFGGDCVTGEATFAAVDGRTKNGGVEDFDVVPKEQLYFSIPWPYRKWTINPRVYIIINADQTPFLQVGGEIHLTRIRQMLMMFTCTSRANTPLFGNADYPNQAFPMVHYVMRPNCWDNTKTILENNIFDRYITDYPEESDAEGKPVLWTRGGFRFRQTLENMNVDYAKQPENLKFYSRQRVGFTEITRFKNQFIWSAAREVAEQNSPAVKTFSALNFRNISNDNGAITKAWDAWSDKGHNLYAVTEKGVCVLMTSRFMARQNTGEPFAVVGSDEEIAEELWISNEHGLPDDYWRTWAEYDTEAFFTNQESVWKIENNVLRNIGDIMYRSRLYTDFIALTHPNYAEEMFGHYDPHHREYWTGFRKRAIILYANNIDIQINLSYAFYDVQGLIFEVYGTGQVKLPTYAATKITSLLIVNRKSSTLSIIDSDAAQTLFVLDPGKYSTILRQGVSEDWASSIPADMTNSVYGNILFVYRNQGENSFWRGFYDYLFDAYTAIGMTTYGSGKGLGTYALNSGVTMNGANVTAGLWIVFVGAAEHAHMSKEWGRIRFITNGVKPTKIEFFETLEQVRAATPVASVDNASVALRNYEGGFETYIPRKSAAPYDRIQNPVLFVRVFYNESGVDFNLISAAAFYYLIK